MDTLLNQLDSVKNFLRTPKRIVITAHANPDGDALGSSLGLYHYLKTLGHQLLIAIPTELPDFLDWMPAYQDIVTYDAQPAIIEKALREAELIFVLDYSGLGRIQDMAEPLANSPAYKIMIDHHLAPESFCQTALWRTSASSTCELMYDFFELLDVLDKVPLQAWECIYVGILTDTGGFKHATSPRLFRVVSNILERGVDNNLINNLVFNAYSFKRFKLLIFCISQRLQLLEELNVGIIAVDKKDHEEWDIKRGDLEGVVNFILQIKKLKVAVLITERDRGAKLSLRSKGNFSVQEICNRYFNGGGHFNASGGSSTEPFGVVLYQVKNLFETVYKSQLTE